MGEPHTLTRLYTPVARLTEGAEGERSVISEGAEEGGATKSQHRQGRAIDIYPPRGMTIVQFREKARMFARMKPLVGALGVYRWGTRPRAGGRLVVWNQVPAGTQMRDARA